VPAQDRPCGAAGFRAPRGQGEVVAEATIVGKVDQQIDVAVRAFFAAGNRAEETEVRSTVPGRNLVQHVASEADVIAQGHGAFYHITAISVAPPARV
jgi:hypothetical protein